MAVALQAKQCLTCRAARQRTVVKCQAGASQKLQLAVATAAAATLVAAPAFAGVILAKPELKRVFVDDGPAAATTSKAASKATAAPEVKAKVESFESGEGFSLSPYSVALPGALLLVGGGAAVALKTDPDFLSRTLIKDSNVFGAGYEEVLKDGNGASIAVKPKAGTKLFKKK